MQTRNAQVRLPGVYSLIRVCPGLPWSGKNIWKMKFFPGQGKVREFCGLSGKFRQTLGKSGKSQGI